MQRIYVSPIDTILLDIDGTLVDSNDAHAHAWTKALAEAGIEEPFASVRPLIGMGADQLLPRVRPDLHHDEEPGKSIAHREGEIFKDRYLHSIRPMDGVRELLLQLKRCGVRRIVATSAGKQQAETMLEIAGVADLIDAMATAEVAARSKPAPDIVHAALLAARSQLANTVMLGDTKYDIEAAHAAGLPAIALRCGGASEGDLTEAAAIFDAPCDFARALERLTLREIVAQGTTS